MILRNRSSGEFFVYDIVNNQITTANSLGTVGLDWSVGGFAADPPSGNSGQITQLVQAMADFGGGGDAADGLDAAAFGSDAQQPFLTTPQNA